MSFIRVSLWWVILSRFPGWVTLAISLRSGGSKLAAAMRNSDVMNSHFFCPQLPRLRGAGVGAFASDFEHTRRGSPHTRPYADSARAAAKHPDEGIGEEL